MKENKTKLLGVYLTPDQYQELREICFKQNIKMAAKARELVLGYMEEERAKAAEHIVEKTEDEVYDEIFDHPKVNFNPPEI